MKVMCSKQSNRCMTIIEQKKKKKKETKPRKDAGVTPGTSWRVYSDKAGTLTNEERTKTGKKK